eukprot:5225462-Amphidinium_carterae.1
MMLSTLANLRIRVLDETHKRAATSTSHAAPPARTRQHVHTTGPAAASPSVPLAAGGVGANAASLSSVLTGLLPAARKVRFMSNAEANSSEKSIVSLGLCLAFGP